MKAGRDRSTAACPAGALLLALTHGAPRPTRCLKGFCLVSGAVVIGAFWSPHLGWLLAKVVLAGIIGGTLVSEVGSKFSLTRACYGWLAAYLRRVLR